MAKSHSPSRGIQLARFSWGRGCVFALASSQRYRTVTPSDEAVHLTQLSSQAVAQNRNGQVIMLFTPFALPFSLSAALLSVALLAGGIWLVWAWYVGIVIGTGYLVGGTAMLLWSALGRFVVLLFRRPGEDEPQMKREGSFQRIAGEDGSELHAELYGNPESPAVVLTHGWGMNSTTWHYLKRRLAETFRLVAWDLPGLGESGAPKNEDFSLEKLAHDLDRVIEAAGKDRVVLVGHSIGGMIILTWCRLFPERLARRVAGIVLANTTYTNPVRTTTGSGFFSAIQKPVLEPILTVISWLWPLVWLMNWLSYLNGTAHIVSIFTGFAGSETRGQLDFATRLGVLASPRVLARGVLAMFRFHERETLSAIRVPVLILSGHLDRLTIPEASASMRSQIPQATHRQLEPAGHASLLERHDEFVQRIAEFVDECRPESGPRLHLAPLVGAEPRPRQVSA